MKHYSLFRTSVFVVLLAVAAFAWVHPTRAVLSTILLASGEGQFTQEPLLPPPLDQMYICWGSYQSTWAISNTTQGDECLYGNDGSRNPIIRASINFTLSFHLEDTRFLRGVDAQMNVTGMASLTSIYTMEGVDLHLFLFDHRTNGWTEIGSGIPQAPLIPNDSGYCDNYTEQGGITANATSLSSVLTSNLTDFADSNGNIQLRWFVQDTVNDTNQCLFARIDYMSIVFTATALPDFTMSLKQTSINIKDPPRSQTINTASTILTVSSTHTFSGTVVLSYSPIFPDMTYGPLISFSSNQVTLSSGQSVKDTVTVYVCPRTPNGTYNFTVTGTSGNLQHSTNLLVTVSGANTGSCVV